MAGTPSDYLVRMAPDVRLAGVSLDCPDPRSLAEFYRALLDLEVAVASDDFVALKGTGIWLTTQRVDEHRAPVWPGADVPKQMHLEMAVRDLDDAERAAIALGATKADTQPSPDRWRVLIDPAGHPFCVTTLIPDD
jgi:Glyoxalase-like domain